MRILTWGHLTTKKVDLFAGGREALIVKKGLILKRPVRVGGHQGPFGNEGPEERKHRPFESYRTVVTERSQEPNHRPSGSHPDGFPRQLRKKRYGGALTAHAALRGEDKTNPHLY